VIETWEDLKFWSSGEWQVVDEKLDDILAAGKTFNPTKENLFNALDECSFADCKVLMLGQDPYPKAEHACGLAFAVPKLVKVLPPTLSNIFDEYESDLGYSRPMNGDLTDWAHRGVLLWNAVPSCLSGHSLSHNWPEWKALTQELISELRGKGIVFVFIGSRVRAFATMVHGFDNCRVIEVGHPSPLAMVGLRNAKNPPKTPPFKGSRIFSRINAALNELDYTPIDWRLQCHPKMKSKKSSDTDTISVCQHFYG